ncbi:DUF5703 domain-containing protein [Thermostilla marina]
MRYLLAISTFVLCLVPVVSSANGPQSSSSAVARYNVIWHSPSTDPSGQMPIGNGDIAAGVYALEDGSLYLLLSKNDAYTYNGDLFKTGRVRIDLEPNPFQKGKPFIQTLDLPTGSIRIEADGVTFRVWADANKPVYHVEIHSPQPLRVRAQPEFWQRFDSCLYNVTSEPIDPPTQDVCVQRDGHIVWYYAVGDRSVYPTELAFYDVPQMAEVVPDPYRFNTFGNLLESPNLTLENDALHGEGTDFDIRIHALTKKAPRAEDWIAAIEAQAKRPIDTAADWKSHCRFWETFWGRSWIMASDNTLPRELREKFDGEGYTSYRTEPDGAALASQAFNVFRYLMACQSRGSVQTKFNGGLFTQPLRYASRPRIPAVQQPDGTWLSHEDARLWGRRFTFQNQRLLYWPLLASGDFDLMQPFFRYYFRLLPIRKAITKAWFGHEGAYYRENIEPTGGERDCGKRGGDQSEAKPRKTPPGENDGSGYYHSYYFTSGLETTAMMIDYYAHTGDEAFRDTVLVPFAREILRFYEAHYPREPDGRLRLDPAQVLETWWIAVNPAPDVAGLHYCTERLLALGVGTDADRRRWMHLREQLPDVPMQQVDGKPALAPAASWELQHNHENGELYPAFPFRLFGVAQGNADIVARTMTVRTVKDGFRNACWTQDQIHWACAGDAHEAAAGLVRRFRTASPLCRFPLYGREGPDSCPDFDHFGSGSVALEKMLVQEHAGKIHLLPAWPAQWDVDFKLHAEGNTVVEGTVENGKLVRWSITPPERRKDVVVHEPQVEPKQPLVPDNAHPFHIGMDASGGSRFSGKILRLSVFGRLLTADEIRQLAESPADAQPRISGLVASDVAPKVGAVLDIRNEVFHKPFTIEAIIEPGEKESGRIADKVTPGGADGFLFDTWPGNSLRAIIGHNGRVVADVLTPKKRHHVALTVAFGGFTIYLDGKPM